jgi:hypothetical protein
VGIFLRALTAVAAFASLAHAAPKPAPPDVTFFVASDTHFGYQGMDEANRRIVAQMNELPGREYPPSIGGRVGEPRGVLVLGDMTDYSTEEQWQAFETVYGLTGKDGLLRFPVFEALGNHDFMGDSPVVKHIERRHGALTYSFDWDRLHVVCLGLYPSAERIRWLEEDLRTVKAGRPIVVFFHYGMEGPYSDSWPSQDERDLFANALEGRRAAILHGHWHRAGHYQWRGHAVFRPGSPKHSSHAFLVVRLRGDELAVGFWNFDRSEWEQGVVTTVGGPDEDGEGEDARGGALRPHGSRARDGAGAGARPLPGLEREPGERGGAAAADPSRALRRRRRERLDAAAVFL